ncbi:ferritin light chain 1-like [Lynx pardinus]|uniref:Ferritin light chain 1-like n=1 Tax=Lynx pardinus TaxID=191816 RepID=A0A485MK65_LYNPA|nr:ferritin light chain 1-like [Lynx pardinus]
MEEQPEGAERTARWQHPLPGPARALPRGGGVKLWTPQSRPGPKENPKSGPLGYARPGFCPLRPHLCDFLESHFLDEEVKLIKEMGNHL